MPIDEHQDPPTVTRSPNSSNSPHLVDVAIVVILPEERAAVLTCLDSHRRDKGSHKNPRQYGWQLGQVKSPDHNTPYTVVVAQAPSAGNVAASLVTTNTVKRWNPRYVMVVGVAGGLRPGDLKKLSAQHPERRITNGDQSFVNTPGVQHGDVVVSEVIWGYEYGKIDSGFTPRSDLTFRSDSSLVSAAKSLVNWQVAIKSKSPTKNKSPKSKSPSVHFGPIASGDKVVDEASDPFFLAVWTKWPKLLAVEMEGAGAAFAIQTQVEEGRSVGFMMVRGISDMPRLGEHPSHSGAQTQQRDDWKPYASATAAAFAIELLRHQWPVPPQQEQGINDTLSLVRDNSKVTGLTRQSILPDCTLRTCGKRRRFCGRLSWETTPIPVIPNQIVTQIKQLCYHENVLGVSGLLSLVLLVPFSILYTLLGGYSLPLRISLLPAGMLLGISLILFLMAHTNRRRLEKVESMATTSDPLSVEVVGRYAVPLLAHVILFSVFGEK